jgi:tRNA(Arg) A34 adenosine deaminase TadA
MEEESSMDRTDDHWLHVTFEVARRAGQRGDEPFGAVLVDATGILLLEAGNTTASERDCTGHAELNLIREACRQYGRDVLAGCTVYASTEPCVMCAGAIAPSGIRRVVFALSAPRFHAWRSPGAIPPSSGVSCKDVFADAEPPIEVIGPVLETEALAVHEDSWPPTS